MEELVKLLIVSLKKQQEILEEILKKLEEVEKNTKYISFKLQVKDKDKIKSITELIKEVIEDGKKPRT